MSGKRNGQATEPLTRLLPRATCWLTGLRAIAWLGFMPLLAAGEVARPNILLVLLDDMGYSDLSCYGGEVQTPHLERLAANGLRFSSFYNCGRCCPTRASLLTGVYPHQAGMGRMTFDEGPAGYRGELGRNVITIAEVLGANGYHTAMVGKWHLSLTEVRGDHLRHLNNQEIRATFADVDSYPVARGFGEHYGIIWGVVNYFDPFSLVQNTEPVREVTEDYYVTDAFTDKTVEYIDRLARQEEPFFLYLAHCAPHWPLHALAEDIAKYEGIYSQGWEQIRRARYDRQLRMGLFDGDTTRLSERFSKDDTWLRNPTAAWDVRAMAVHAAMIDRVDQGMGRILSKLDELGELDNTLIMVLSDNGASREEPALPGFDRVSETRSGKPVLYYGGGKPQEVLPGAETTYAGIGPEWANVANTPFRLFKASQYEGGIRTPLIVHWPAGLQVAGGSITHEMGHVIDVMATCLDVAGLEHPRQFEGRRLTPLEGKSLLPLLQGLPRGGRGAICFEHFGARAIREGDWKLVASEGEPWELYHLATDQSETRDLAEQHPERVRAMNETWEEWAGRTGVLPAP